MALFPVGCPSTASATVAIIATTSKKKLAASKEPAMVVRARAKRRSLGLGSLLGVGTVDVSGRVLRRYACFLRRKNLSSKRSRQDGRGAMFHRSCGGADARQH